MAVFHIKSIDKAGALELRMQTRPQHLEYLEKLGEKLLLAGPILDDNDKPKGTVALIVADSLKEAQEIAAQDPYDKVDLFQSTEIVKYNPLFGSMKK